MFTPKLQIHAVIKISISIQKHKYPNEVGKQLSIKSL